MTEAVVQQAVEQPAEDIEQPQSVEDSVFEDLYRATTGMPQRDVPQQPAQPQQPVEETGSAEGNVEQLQEQLNQLRGAMAAMLQQRNQQPAPTANAQDMAKSFEQELIEDNPDLDPKAVKWMVDTAGKIAQHQIQNSMQSEIAPLKKELNELRGFAAQTANERVLNEYDNALNQLASQAGIEDSYTRDLLKDAVAARGQRLYGQNFNMDHARKLFRDLNNQRLHTGHEQQAQYVAQKQQQQTNTPPVQHAEGNASSAIESLQNQIRDPKNRQFDMRSQGMMDVVGKFLDAGDKAVNAMLGGGQQRG